MAEMKAQRVREAQDRKTVIGETGKPIEGQKPVAQGLRAGQIHKAGGRSVQKGCPSE